MENIYVQFYIKNLEDEQLDEKTTLLPLPILVGRSRKNTLRLNHQHVSAHHAKLEQLNDRLILSDLDSANGTKVNSRKVSSLGVKNGDEFEIGPFRITIETLTVEPLINVVRCSNCERSIPSDCRSCLHCGYFCDTADTVHAVIK